MSQISDIQNPWRLQLLNMKASFKGVQFHVETGSMASGRRTVTHEYPKRDLPYAEDMGRHARRLTFSGYLIYRVNPPPGQASYVQQRNNLMRVLDAPDAGPLIHPVFCRTPLLAMCERYSMIESREKGGYTQFEMSFVEAGNPGNTLTQTNTSSTLSNKSKETGTAMAGTFDIVKEGWYKGPETVA